MARYTDEQKKKFRDTLKRAEKITKLISNINE